MNNLEIERKFLVSPTNSEVMDILAKNSPNIENRYYLYRKDGVEIRITSILKPDSEYVYNLDRMEVWIKESTDSHIVRKKERFFISNSEFEGLLKLICKDTPGVEPVVRWSYAISENPKIEIKVYKNKFEGLIRAEVEFDSIEESQRYKKLGWMMVEITDLDIGRDVNLPDLSKEEFAKIMAEINS